MNDSPRNHPTNQPPTNDPDNSVPAPAARCGRPPAGSRVPSHRNRPDTIRVRVDVAATRASLAATLADALAQGWALAREVDRLAGLLADERLRYANLWAAVRAAVHADDDGETDPLSYLRIECPELHTDPELFTDPGQPDAPVRGRR
jgi:hypothetical protein